MLNEHTLDQLKHLRLDGMVRAIEEQAMSTAAAGLSFDERLTLLVQREVAWRDDRRVQRLLKAAKLKVSAVCIEDINWRTHHVRVQPVRHRHRRHRRQWSHLDGEYRVPRRGARTAGRRQARHLVTLPSAGRTRLGDELQGNEVESPSLYNSDRLRRA